MIDMDKAAAALIGARLGNTILDSFPGGSFPADVDEAYAVLDRIAAKMTAPVVGWKAALTNDEIMKKMNATAPACGPLFEPYIASSPMRVALPAESGRGLECEFAFRMAKTLAPRAEPYTDAEVAAAVATMHPAMEVVDVRVKDGFAHGARGIIGDFCANAALALGPGVEDWQGIDLAASEVELRVDGEYAVTGVGSAVLGNPRNSLTWVANFLSGRGIALEAGHVVTTGSTMGIFNAPAGSTAVADFGTLGQVEITFA
ncbi:MAG: fumarylacetoacetate hydrolase family protein [Alphaproteobacteria bacterium]